jgi:hypothetical protein
MAGYRASAGQQWRRILSAVEMMSYYPIAARRIKPRPSFRRFPINGGAFFETEDISKQEHA